jgi:hypothetical protein
VIGLEIVTAAAAFDPGTRREVESQMGIGQEKDP